jgi:DNA-binding ferritin-like protein (oxidative damage protectant)
MKANIGVKPEHLVEIAKSLNRLLADEHVLYIKTRNAHWNVEGPDFYTKHKFFEDHYRELQNIIDDVAERVRLLGHYAVASMKDYLQLTHLTEESREKNDSEGFTRELLQDHETIIKHLRENINRYADEWFDQGTSDFITGLMEKHEEMAWMLRAHLM